MLPAAPALSMLCLQTSPSIFYEYKVPFLAPWLEKRLSSKRFRRQRKSCFIFYFIFRAKCPDSSTSRWPLFLGLHPAQLGAFWCLCRAQVACSTHHLPRLEGETTLWQPALAAETMTLNFPCLIAVSPSYLFCNVHFSRHCRREKCGLNIRIGRNLCCQVGRKDKDFILRNKKDTKEEQTNL